MKKSIILKLNHIVFWWYYKRVPVFFHKWTVLKSIRILVFHYESAKNRFKRLEEVCSNASEREREMRTEISNLNLKLRFMGVPDVEVQQLNRIFGTDLKGITKQEIRNKTSHL